LYLVILIVLYFLISKDLKDKANHKYYLASLLLTAIFFIFSYTGFVTNFLALTEKMLLSIAIVAVLIVYLFAHIVSFIHEAYKHLKEKYKGQKPKS
jgi:amino acid transporter